MPYHTNLSSISLDDYKAKLHSKGMIPSRQILKNKIDERFDYFIDLGIRNVQELLGTLKKKERFAELSKVSFLAGDYLAILLRELNSMLPKPNKLKDFTGISTDTISKLEKAGIKDTLKLYDKVLDRQSRKELTSALNINETELIELAKLSDVSRIKWVGAIFARMLIDIGIDTVEKASKADYNELHRKINQINKEKNYFKGQIGLNDMKLFVEAANELKQEIVY